MDLLPVFMNVRDQSALVIGGGDVAARKVSLLLDAGAKVSVVAPDICSTLLEQAEAHKIGWRRGRFVPADLEGRMLVIAATDDNEVNREVSRLAKAHHLPVNVVDNPELCSFVMPSIIDRSPVQIAVSTGGASPVLARLLRMRLEAAIPSTYGRLAALVERYRSAVKGRFSSVNGRRVFWESVLQGRIAELVFSGKEEEAERALEKAIAEGEDRQVGEVYLVGGGPGDPDLLTFRDADRIYVGKERDNHSVPQDQINQLLVDLAKQGKRVCRLKGGDPFVFGRGGEEIETLMANGVTFQVVPGITAALGTAAYAGIPLTHRDHSQAVVFVTGHLKDHTMNLNWKSLAAPNQTVVFYMGLKGLPVICNELTAHGLPGETPIALVQQATTPRQRVFTATLATINHEITGKEIQAPTLIVVGHVVKLHEKLNWFRSEEQIRRGEH
jgi:uroporphyrin-III C-methyltransferase/precorrin-2 dehydrogenase/sirohydrochlorin ferrochelatase